MMRLKTDLIKRPQIMLAVAAILFVVPNPVPAQFTYGIDTGLNSSYVWRGVTRRNAFVSQSDGYVALRISSLYLTAGAWINMELTRANPFDPTALGYGSRIGEQNGWLEAGFQSQKIELAGGVVGYRFENRTTSAALGNIVSDNAELYGRVAWHPKPFSLGTTVYREVANEVAGDKSWYIESRVLWEAPLLPVGPTLLRIGGIMGWQDNSSDHVAPSGVTHWEVFTETQLSVGLLGLLLYALPSLHVQLNVDDTTRRVRRVANPGQDVKVWVGLSVSYLRR